MEVYKSGPSKGKVSKVVIQGDTAKRIDKNGMSESQEYEYTPNPKSVKQTFTLRKTGEFREVGGSAGLIIGSRDEYYDFSF